MSYKLKGTGNYKVNIPNDIITELGWKIHDDVHVIIAEEHHHVSSNLTHNTISIERVEDYNKYMEEEE